MRLSLYLGGSYYAIEEHIECFVDIYLSYFGLKEVNLHGVLDEGFDGKFPLGVNIVYRDIEFDRDKVYVFFSEFLMEKYKEKGSLEGIRYVVNVLDLPTICDVTKCSGVELVTFSYNTSDIKDISHHLYMWCSDKGIKYEVRYV